jgi:hypothetical protein
MLDPAFNLRRIAVKRRQPNPWFKRGTVFAEGRDFLMHAHVGTNRHANQNRHGRARADQNLSGRQVKDCRR